MTTIKPAVNEPVTLNCLIIDNNNKSGKLLEDQVRRIPFFKLTGLFKDSSSALKAVKKQKTDLIFLNIKAPGGNELELIKSLEKPPLIILITESESHVLEASSLNVIDYLIKPFTIERFQIASEKALDLFTLRLQRSENHQHIYDHIFVNAGYSLVKVRFKDIIYIGALRDYVKIHVINSKPVLTRIGMRDILNKLPAGIFMRVHKSFIVGLEHIESVQKYKIIASGTDIPIGESYRNNLNTYILKVQA